MLLQDWNPKDHYSIYKSERKLPGFNLLSFYQKYNDIKAYYAVYLNDNNVI